MYSIYIGGVIVTVAVLVVTVGMFFSEHRSRTRVGREGERLLARMYGRDR